MGASEIVVLFRVYQNFRCRRHVCRQLRDAVDVKGNKSINAGVIRE